MSSAIVRGAGNAMNPHGSQWAHGATVSASAPPTITSFTPSSGAVGSSVSIVGTNFDGIITVTFNGTVGTVTAQSSTSLSVKVPSGASSGKINVANALGNVDSATDFTVSVSAGSAPVYLPDNMWMGIAGSTGFENDRVDMWNDMLSQGLNLKIVRLGFNWSTIEPNQTDGPTHWFTVDSVVQGALDAGLEILMNPCYAAATWTGGQFDVPGNISWASFKTKYVALCKAMVNRYHKNGTAKAGFITNTKYVKFYEMWNEANNVNFWKSTDNANGFGMGQPDPFYYAELLAAAYDAMKGEVGADAVIGWGGFAVASLTDPAGPFKWEANWMGHLLDWWSAHYTKYVDGWAAIPADMGAMHPYVSGRPPNKVGVPPQTPYNVLINQPTNVFAAKIPAVWNLLDNAGFGSIKIWATEAGGAWREDAITGQGVRYGASSPPQTADEWKIMSPSEAYNHERIAFRITQNLDPFPSGNQLVEFNDCAGVAEPTRSTRAVAHLGPRFYFGLRDHFGTPYSTPRTVEENYGLYKKLAGAGGTWKDGTDTWALKRLTGTSNDVFEALKQF
jgi:hypothetical protein